MGRSRKCNWKRKQLKANKKVQYKNLNKSQLEGLLDTIILKNRRGNYVVGYAKDSEAMKAFDTAVKHLKYLNDPEKLRGAAPDYTHMFRTADGRYIDPEMGDINRLSPEEFEKVWTEVFPKFHASSKHIGVPLVFGTAGSIEQPHWAYEVYKNAIKDDKLFIPAGSYHEESGPFPVLPKDFFEYDPNGRNK